MIALVVFLAGAALGLYGARTLGKTETMVLDVDRQFIIGWAALTLGVSGVILGVWLIWEALGL